MKKSAVTILGLCALGLIGTGLEKSSVATEFSSRANVGFNFNEVMSVNISGDIEVNGLAAGQQKDSDAVNIVVTTNSSGGYVLGATVGTDANKIDDLVYAESSITDKKFTNIATDADLVSLNTDNTWGYKVSEDNSVWSNYNGLALLGDMQSILRDKSGILADGSETTYFRIGAKASSDIVPGDYINSITFYAVAKAVVPVTSLCGDKPTMQNLDKTLFSVENAQVQLCDERDGKTYYAAKLADGNIWMTQNLDYVLDPSKPLTPEDSDVTSNWTPSIATQTTQYKELNGTTHTTGADNALWDTTDTTFGYNYAPHSYRPASDSTAGMSGKFGENTDTYSSPVFMQNGTTMKDWKTMADCINAGNSEELCAHWNVGTFYSWYAATAGTGDSSVTSDGANATSSICPAGWRLPTSTSSGDFQKLVTEAGITASNITAAPFYFLRSGYYRGSYGAVYNAGSFGDYWSSTLRNSSEAYYLNFGSGNVSPSDNHFRYYGMSVRCVAR